MRLSDTVQAVNALRREDMVEWNDPTTGFEATVELVEGMPTSHVPATTSVRVLVVEVRKGDQYEVGDEASVPIADLYR